MDGPMTATAIKRPDIKAAEDLSRYLGVYVLQEGRSLGFSERGRAFFLRDLSLAIYDFISSAQAHNRARVVGK